MFSKSKVKKVDFVTLSKFYGKYKEALQLELINSPAGLSRHICEPALNRRGGNYRQRPFRGSSFRRVRRSGGQSYRRSCGNNRLLP